MCVESVIIFTTHRFGLLITELLYRASVFVFAVFFLCVCEFYTFLAAIVELNLAEVITKQSKLAVERKTERSRASEQQSRKHVGREVDC